MSALTKSMHPDEKYKAGKLGAQLTKVGVALAVVSLGISLVLTLAGSADPNSGHASKWARFFHAYVFGWSYIFSLCLGMLFLVLLHGREIGEQADGAVELVGAVEQRRHGDAET